VPSARRELLTGLVGFALASAVGGAAVDTGMLFGARALQGVFGALLAPAALSLVTTTFTKGRERATAFGVFSAIAMAGSAIGLLLGGALTEYVDWRWCLYVNILFAAAAFAGAAAFVRDDGSRNRNRLDLPGTLLGTGGLLALVWGFATAETDGWTAPLTVGMFAAALVLLVTFVAVEARTRAPLLPLRVVTDRNRAGVYLGIGLAMIAMFAQFLFLAYYLQLIKGYSPLLSGVAFLPMTVCLTIGSTQVGAPLMNRVPARRLMVPGFLATAAAMALLAQLTPDSSYWAVVLPAQIVLGLGMGTAFTPDLATYGVRPEDAGIASAMLNTSQQIGGSIGTALLNTIAAGATTAWAATHAGDAAGAAVHGYTTAFWWAAGVLVLAAAIIAACVTAGTGNGSAATTTAEPDRTAVPVLTH
jgi:EmrB/QacA subfamily drug resistance transporter